MNVFWNNDKNYYFNSKVSIPPQSEIQITSDRLSATALRADFRIEKKKISRIRRHWQAFCNGLRFYYAMPLGLNLLTGLVYLVLLASITLLHKLPHDYYFPHTPRIIILIDTRYTNQVKQIEKSVASHLIIKTTRHISPQEGFHGFLASLNHQDNTLKTLHDTMLAKADNLPHVLEIIPHVRYLVSPQLTIFLKQLNHRKDITHIQLDKTAFKTVHTQYMNQKKRVGRLIMLCAIMSIILMGQYWHGIYRVYPTIPSLVLLYYTISLVLALSSITALSINKIQYILSTALLLPPLSIDIIWRHDYPMIVLNTALLSAAGFLLSDFPRLRLRKQNSR